MLAELRWTTLLLMALTVARSETPHSAADVTTRYHDDDEPSDVVVTSSTTPSPYVNPRPGE